jgi:hypothetical protein
MDFIVSSRGENAMRRCLLGLVAFALLHACSSRPPMTIRPVDGGGVESVGSGGADALAVTGSGGLPGAGSGGIPGTGDGAADGGEQVACPDGGLGLPAAARPCEQDSDCTLAIEGSCCGPTLALGVAKSQAASYASCFALPPGSCDLYMCPASLGYTTDTGRTTAEGRVADQVSVRCLHRLCTSDVAGVQDAGRDAPPAVDADVELPTQTCGDAAACALGQACVLSGGGPVPRCQEQEDGGVCVFGLVPVASCSSSSGMTYGPGCADPAPTPQCRGLADGCGDPCSCVCPGAGCYPGPGYTICSYP